MLYAVNYDLKAPGRNYAGLYDAIKSCGAWWHYLGSTWLIDTALTADGVWDRLASHIDTNDTVLVIAVGADEQGWLPKKAWAWINARLTAQAAKAACRIASPARNPAGNVWSVPWLVK